jgi:hypothetical protein
MYKIICGSRFSGHERERDHLRVWGIRRNFFEYVDVLEQEKAIGIKKKSHFFFRAHCRVVAPI